MATFKKEDSGKWSFRATTGSRENRKRIYRTGFKTKREAVQAASSIESSMDRGQSPELSRADFPHYFNSWINTFKIGKHSASTDRWYKTAAGYIEEYFSGTPIGKINRVSYQQFIDWLGTTPRGKFKKPLSKSTVSRVNAYVRTVVKDAIEDGAIARDFTRRVELGGREGKPESEKYLSLADFHNVIKLAKHRADMRHMADYVLIFQAYTGARYEEALGLSWDRVDFDNMTVKFDRSWNYKSRKQFNSFGGLKNDPSYRTIAISQTLADVLRRLQVEQTLMFQAQKFKDPDNLVFRNANHRMGDNAGANDTLRRLCVASNTKNVITTHGLRHTHGSVLIYEGVDLLSVSRRLGHGNIQTTADTYVHEIDEMKARDDKKITDILDKV